MGRRAHPLRRHALALMRGGLATPGEIARATGLPLSLVDQWRYRAGIVIVPRRVARVQTLLERRVCRLRR